MDDTPRPSSRPDDVAQLKARLAARDQPLAQRDQLIAQHQVTIATLTTQRDEFYLEKLRLEVRLVPSCINQRSFA